MEISEVTGKVPQQYSETVFQICFLSPFPTATTLFPVFFRCDGLLTGLLASAVAHLSPTSPWLAEAPFRTPSPHTLSPWTTWWFSVSLPLG